MVTFKCAHTGCLVTFTNENDIEQMRQHLEYEEVREEDVVTEDVVVKTRRGRKPKTETEKDALE